MRQLAKIWRKRWHRIREMAAPFLALTGLNRGNSAEAYEHYVRALALHFASTLPDLFLKAVVRTQNGRA